MLYDLHNDFATKYGYSRYDGYLRSAGDTTVTAAIFTSEMHGDIALAVGKIADRLKPKGIPTAIEDIGFSAENELFRDFDFSEYSYCSLTWNGENAFAGGAFSDGTLTSLGRRAIERLNSCGCALDTAHLNKMSFFAAADASARVLCSHTGFNGHPRSLDENRIKTIVSRGGIIGLSVVTAFTDATDVRSFACVIDGFVERYGEDNLAIGTDFCGTRDLPHGIRGYRDFEKVRAALTRMGYGENSINKIFYANAKNFFAAK